MAWDRRGSADHRDVIACRTCGEPLQLERVNRLAGRALIECLSCHNLIWVRGTDARDADGAVTRAGHHASDR